jgi:imidazolonepropionase-like amidohydrolase
VSRRGRLWGALLTALAFALPCAAEDVALRADLAVDGRGRAIPSPLIVVRDERIVSVASSQAVPGDSRVIDLSGFTLLPGLIDAHLHMGAHFPPLGLATPGSEASAAARNARCLLESGFTSVRSLGSLSSAVLALRAAIGDGRVVGPRLLVAGQALRSDGAALSEREMRAAARLQLERGVDWLKLFATGSSRAGGKPTWSLKEMRWAVEEARARGVPVAAHAHAAEGARRAILAGARTIEHGALLSDDVLELMKERGTWFVPNLYLSEYYLEHSRKFRFGERAVEWTQKLLPLRTQVFRKALALGVKIVFGTDAGAGWIASGTTALEFERRVRAGQSPQDALVSATGRAAEALLLSEEIGDLKAGLQADVIAVQGNPLEDVAALGRVVFVMRAGKIHRAPQAPFNSSCDSP